MSGSGLCAGDEMTDVSPRVASQIRLHSSSGLHPLTVKAAG